MHMHVRSDLDCRPIPEFSGEFQVDPGSSGELSEVPARSRTAPHSDKELRIRACSVHVGAPAAPLWPTLA
eukprot:4957472-Alexandrium_andersonii.AAC.1